MALSILLDTSFILRKGDHIKFKHPGKPGHVVVPHPRKDVAIGTLRNIYRQAGWDWR
ncbi:type II toxin-antitoxin system HicA family toxin [Aromatoleum buckelii]|uniref:Addiction module toxin, HicA family n=1 Tax=Aromatoleum buckelii TaxID=200254 RepID=A0ABX1N7R9_9RHOO|nr:type II toxin-antitoxin system HicA family toxin [Aromatoleum buckelii]MCK0512728.1 type II toxin-antitoxin system HicA family toxin [Aromatoleum buckelii]